jgi:transposase
MVAFFKALAPTVIGIEACAAAHYWGRLLGSFGHEVKLIAPRGILRAHCHERPGTATDIGKIVPPKDQLDETYRLFTRRNGAMGQGI